MKSLLDKFLPIHTAFRPRTPADLFSLRLAQKLDDAAAVRHYVSLADRHPQGQMVSAYRRTKRAQRNGNLGRQFLAELGRVHSNASHNGWARLISIRVARRAVAAAVFYGDQLEYTDARQLSSTHDRALSSAVGFINWMLNRFPVESAALEAITNEKESQRRVLHNAIGETLRNRLLPIWEIPKTALLDGCGHPPLKSRGELREIASTIWPILAGTHAKVFIQDAAILGLHVQIERLFIIN